MQGVSAVVGWTNLRALKLEHPYQHNVDSIAQAGIMVHRGHLHHRVINTYIVHRPGVNLLSCLPMKHDIVTDCNLISLHQVLS